MKLLKVDLSTDLWKDVPCNRYRTIFWRNKDKFKDLKAVTIKEIVNNCDDASFEDLEYIEYNFPGFIPKELLYDIELIILNEIKDFLPHPIIDEIIKGKNLGKNPLDLLVNIQQLTGMFTGKISKVASIFKDSIEGHIDEENKKYLKYLKIGHLATMLRNTRELGDVNIDEILFKFVKERVNE